MSTKSIGSILSLQGIIQTFATLLMFPIVSGKLGSLRTFRLAVLSYPLLYILVPYLTVAPEWLRMPGLYLVIVWKVTAQAFALPPIQILLANSAPSKRVLGTLNGTAASSASLCRAFGPTFSGLIQAAGLSIGCVGLPWWTSSVVAVSGAVLSLLLVEQSRGQIRAQLVEEEAAAKLDLDMEAADERLALHVLELDANEPDQDVEPMISISSKQ